MRDTVQRREILTFLRSRRQQCSAVQVYDAVREKLPNISLGTVYRNLGHLLEDGEIIAVETSDKCVYYDGFVQDHAHFVCDGCKNIFDFPLKREIAQDVIKAGFSIEAEKVVYYGKCADCRSQK